MLKTENCINNRVNNKLTTPKYLRLSHLPLATTKESETRESQACHYLNSHKCITSPFLTSQTESN